MASFKNVPMERTRHGAKKKMLQINALNHHGKWCKKYSISCLECERGWSAKHKNIKIPFSSRPEHTKKLLRKQKKTLLIRFCIHNGFFLRVLLPKPHYNAINSAHNDSPPVLMKWSLHVYLLIAKYCFVEHRLKKETLRNEIFVFCLHHLNTW